MFLKLRAKRSYTERKPRQRKKQRRLRRPLKNKARREK
jgi:hypothetical protein|tara:strand:- start:374 stop:487 length:114 start_codon:yes stop_codon:yes gene_type:complete